MYDLQQDRDKADSFHRKNLQLNSITVNSWDSAGRLLTTKEYYMQCRWKYLTEPDVCSATTVYTYSHDTLIQTLHSYMGEWQTLVSKHYSLPSGTVYEESQRGDKSVSFYLKNDKGLPIRMEKYEITAEGNMKQLVDTYQYKFNQ